jgi:hypothetical protein
VSLGRGRRSQAWFPGSPACKAELQVSGAPLRQNTGAYASVSGGVCGGWRERVCPPRCVVPASLPLPRPPRLRALPREPRYPARSMCHGAVWSCPPSAGARAPAGAYFGKLEQTGVESPNKVSANRHPHISDEGEARPHQ